jgi:hypothetical protein
MLLGVCERCGNREWSLRPHAAPPAFGGVHRTIHLNRAINAPSTNTITNPPSVTLASEAMAVPMKRSNLVNKLRGRLIKALHAIHMEFAVG